MITVPSIFVNTLSFISLPFKAVITVLFRVFTINTLSPFKMSASLTPFWLALATASLSFVIVPSETSMLLSVTRCIACLENTTSDCEAGCAGCCLVDIRCSNNALKSTLTPCAFASTLELAFFVL